MARIDITAPVAGLLDRIVADPQAREAARRALADPATATDVERATAEIAALLAEARSDDRWTSRARPSFLYVMYALLLWSIPLGLIAAVRPALAHAIAAGMSGYLAALPEPLYALFGTGYLGYTVARQWGKASGTDR